MSQEGVNPEPKLSLEQLKAQVASLDHEQRKKLLRPYGRVEPTRTGQTSRSDRDQPRLVMQQTTWSSPIPPAEEMARIEAIIPGGPNRILTIFEEQARHRMNLETITIKAQIDQGSRGQHYALVIAFGAIAAALVLTYMGHPAVAGAIASIVLGTLCAVFITGKVQETRSRRGKAEAARPEPAQ